MTICMAIDLHNLLVQVGIIAVLVIVQHILLTDDLPVSRLVIQVKVLVGVLMGVKINMPDRI